MAQKKGNKKESNNMKWLEEHLNTGTKDAVKSSFTAMLPKEERKNGKTHKAQPNFTTATAVEVPPLEGDSVPLVVPRFFCFPLRRRLRCLLLSLFVPFAFPWTLGVVNVAFLSKTIWK